MALLLLYPLVPESPHWLAVSGDVAGADAVLRRMAAVNGAQLPPGRLECPAGLSATSASGEFRRHCSHPCNMSGLRDYMRKGPNNLSQLSMVQAARRAPTQQVAFCCTA